MEIDDIKQSDRVGNEYPDYLDDESGIVKNGEAEKILFPQNIDELSCIVSYCNNYQIPITVSGGGTGISGGRVPRTGWIIATDEITTITSQDAIKWTDKESGLSYEYTLSVISDTEAEITIPISMTLKAFQNLCRELNWFYPVDPTERSSFIGGNIATNASGARTFKYGTTRDWVKYLKVILPTGEIIDLSRSDDKHQITKKEIIIHSDRSIYKIPRPSYQLPNTDKNVAGPVITDHSDVMDLFIGTGGMFGIIAQPSFRLIRPPKEQISLFLYTKDRDQAYRIISQAQHNKQAATNPIPMSVEFLGPRAVDIIKHVDTKIPSDASSLVMLEQDADSEEEMMDFIEYWWEICDKIGVLDTSVAQTHNEIEHHKMLRHKVPETVNSTVRSYGQAKLGTDYSVPNKFLREFFEYIFDVGQEFEQYQNNQESVEKFGYAVWAHAGDSHIHLNLLPRNDEEDKYAKNLITKILYKVVELNGSIAAEHGLGKKMFDGKPAIVFQYGEEVIEELRAMKLAIDKNNILSPGNLID